MGKIYKGAIGFKISPKPVVDISTVIAGSSVKGKAPSGTVSTWSATIDVTNEKIYYITQTAADLDEAGEWFFWGHYLFTDGAEIDGEPVAKHVYDPGTGA